MFPEHRPGYLLHVIRHEEPVAVAAGQVDRRVTPALRRLGGGRLAGFNIGVVGSGQAEFDQAGLATFEHAVQRGQVLTVLDGMFGPLEDLLNRQLGEGIQPQLLDLLELGLVRVGGVILVVVIQPKQGKDLVDGLYVALVGRLLRVSSPSWCR